MGVEFRIIRNTSDTLLASYVQKAPRALGSALFKEALIETRESMRRTPVQYGVLRASHQTEKPVLTGRSISVLIKCGGQAAPYAQKVHNDIEVFHKNGQALFMFSTLKESAPFLAGRVMKRLPEEMKSA